MREYLENLEKVLTFVNKKGYNEYNNRDTLNVSCLNQMLAATLFAGYKCIGVQMLLGALPPTNKCVGGQMLIKIYLFEGRFFVNFRRKPPAMLGEPESF